MRLLLVAATRPEIEPLLLSLNLTEGKNTVGIHHVFILITGVGMVATSFFMGSHLASHRYDLALNAGIAGSFDHSIALGELVLIREDCFAELGAEDGDKFLSIDEMGFGKWLMVNDESLMVNNGWDKQVLDGLKQVKGITVNTVHGNAESISKIVSRLHPQTESMEGAAFFYSCKQVKLMAIQVRAISNYVEPRNKSSWNIPLAIKNLNTFAAEFLKRI